LLQQHHDAAVCGCVGDVAAASSEELQEHMSLLEQVSDCVAAVQKCSYLSVRIF
jgi:hypothetical protein